VVRRYRDDPTQPFQLLGRRLALRPSPAGSPGRSEPRARTVAGRAKRQRLDGRRIALRLPAHRRPAIACVDVQCSLAVPLCPIACSSRTATTDAAALPNGARFTVVTVIPLEELRRSAMSVLFEGGDDAPISFFVTEFPRGRGPDLHMHPYP
jgi:hypothetical protein